MRPPAAPEPCHAGLNILTWMERQFSHLGDIYQARLDGVNAYVVRAPHAAEYVLRTNWQNYAKGRTIKRIEMLLGNGLMTSEGELWKRQRRMIQPAFHRDSLAALAEIISSANAALIDRWLLAASRRESVDLGDDVSRLTLEITLRSMFSRDYDRVRPHFELLVDESARNVAFAEAFRESGRAIGELVEKRRKQKSVFADMLHYLMMARDPDTGQAMPDRQLVNEVKTLIVASHETTASTLQWLWYLLSQHRDVEDRLVQELRPLGSGSPTMDGLAKYPYARHVIDEVMRLYPAGWLVTRRALADDQLADCFVPAGTEVYLPIYFIQRHPSLWAEAEVFEPSRHEAERASPLHRLALMPFSAGPRNCIGEHLARAEIQIHLMLVTRRLGLRYAGTEPPGLDVGVNLRPKVSLHMTPWVRDSPTNP
jgi:cytochrome P450